MESPDVGTCLVAWVAAPLVVILGSLGLGLLVLRAAGITWNLFALPLGFFSGIVVVGLLLRAGAIGWVAAVVVLALAAAGLALSVVDVLRGRSARPSPMRVIPAACLVLLVYALGIAPLLATGAPGVVGFEVLNDSAAHISMTDYLFWNGAKHGEVGMSSYERVTAGLLDADYPGGRYAWPLVGMAATGAGALEIYTPIGAVGMAVLAVVGMSILMRLGMPAWGAALGGGVGAVGYLQFSYVLQGGDRDVAFAAGVFALWLAAALVEGNGRAPRSAIPALAILVGAYMVSGLLIAIWVVLGLIALLCVALWRTVRNRPLRPSVAGLRRRLDALGPRRAVVTIGVAAAIVAGAILGAVEGADFARSFSVSRSETGNMTGFVPIAEVSNVSFAFDFRDPVRLPVLTYGFVVLSGSLAAVGLVLLVRRWAWYLLAPVVFGILAGALVAAVGSAYFATKVWIVLAAGAGLYAAVGVWAIARAGPRWRVVGLSLGAIGLAGVVASDYSAYAGARVTPEARFREARDINARFAGSGPAVVTESDHYMAYLMKDVPALVVPVNSNSAALFPGHRPLPRGRLADLKQFDAHELGKMPLIIERSGPLKSTPPPGYDLAYSGDAYAVWQRVANPSMPRTFLDLGSPESGIGRLDCDGPEVKKLIRAASLGRSPILVRRAGPPPVVIQPLDPRLDREGHWAATKRGSNLFAKSFVGSGSITASFTAPAGKYAVWLRANPGSGVDIVVDGNSIGSATQPSYEIDQFERVGSVELVAGPHTVTIQERSRNVLMPGNRRSNEVALLVLDPETGAGVQRPIQSVGASDLKKDACKGNLDWLAVR